MVEEDGEAMTVWDLKRGMSPPEGYYVPAGELRNLLKDWEERLTNDGRTWASTSVVTELYNERMSLHCEPPAPTKRDIIDGIKKLLEEL